MNELIGTAVSERLENFLDFIKEAEQICSISADSEAETNDLTQDLLHSIELEEHGYHELAKLAKELREIRRERRIAKDNQNVVLPLVEWAQNNRAVIKSLERVLGETRKKERHLENRVYFPRTKGRKEDDKY